MAGVLGVAFAAFFFEDFCFRGVARESVRFFFDGEDFGGLEVAGVLVLLDRLLVEEPLVSV